MGFGSDGAASHGSVYDFGGDDVFGRCQDDGSLVLVFLRFGAHGCGRG